MKLGHLPEGWRIAKLKEFLKRDRTYITELEDKWYPRISVKWWAKGAVVDKHDYGPDIQMTRHQLAKSGQIIVSEIWAKHGSIGIIPPDGEGSLITSHFFLFDLNKQGLKKGYLDTLILSNYFMPQCAAQAKGSTGYASIRPDDFLICDFPLPPIAEQCQIATILRDADANIAYVEAQIEAANEVKRGAMQKFYSQAYDSNKVPNMRLKKLLKSVSRPEPIVENQLYKLCGVKWHAEGVHIHDELVGNDIKTGQLSRVMSGDVMYNKMWASNRAFGIAKEEHNGAYVTSEYPQFTIQQDLLFPTYLEKFFYSYPCQTQAKIFSRGTTSRARVNPRDFLRIEIPLPPIDKQCEIAAILSAHDATIHSLQDEAARLREVKHGLMQKLLSGQMRI
jgi:type I restriction enzyme S subunit